MLSQEYIYELIQKRDWATVLHTLHQQKSKIAEDPLLQQSARIFEAEFSKLFQDDNSHDSGFTKLLEKLYMLHAGKFFPLKPSTLKQLIIQLAQRKQNDESYHYAKMYPEEPETRLIISAYENANPLRERVVAKLTHREWLEIFNRLFEIINQQGNPVTYYSGPRFIDTVKELDTYFPDYKQYIDLRNQEGKSTSRKLFFYDILMDEPEDLRKQIVLHILEQVQKKEPEKVQAIKMLLGLQSVQMNIIKKTEIDTLPIGTPIVFISYSWDDSAHEEWVLSLAEFLRSSGVDVILDKYELRAGRSVPHFVEQSIKRANKILIIFTPGYKEKAEERKGGVGYEYSIMNASLYRNQTKNDKFIPMLRIGTEDQSIPTFMQQYIHLDFRNDLKFEVSCIDLLREIFEEPFIKKPALGKRPKLS